MHIGMLRSQEKDQLRSSSYGRNEPSLDGLLHKLVDHSMRETVCTALLGFTKLESII